MIYKGGKDMRKILAYTLAAVMAVSVSALEASNTNTSVTYLPVFEDFFNFDSIFDFFERIFNIFGFTSDLYAPVI
jgi:hypothetical protein